MFSRVLAKSLPQSVLAPWRAVLTGGFPRVWAKHPKALSGSFRAGFALRAIPVPTQPWEEASHAASRQVFLDAVAHGSVISWQHINLLGEYDFSDGKLRDSVGIQPPKIDPLKRSKIWGLPNHVMCFSHRDL